jgi:hypothetical protein
MKDEGLRGKLLFGALVGAGFGLVIAWAMASRAESQSDPTSQALKKPVTVNEILGLGFALLKVGRQAADLVRKA